MFHVRGILDPNSHHPIVIHACIGMFLNSQHAGYFPMLQVHELERNKSIINLKQGIQFHS